MEQQKDNVENGFLQGLRKIFFQDATPVNSQSTPPVATHHEETTPQNATPTSVYDGAGLKEGIRRNIMQLLDARNKQGVDFLEVWRAAQDMGGATPANIRMAFTSLKHADPVLSRERLLQTGQDYILELESAFSGELKKREAERVTLKLQKEQARVTLQKSIGDLEAQIAALQIDLDLRKKEWQELQQPSDPGLALVESKIRYGKEAMDTVVLEIQQVLSIIQQEIN